MERTNLRQIAAIDHEMDKILRKSIESRKNGDDVYAESLKNRWMGLNTALEILSNKKIFDIYALRAELNL